MPKTYVSIHIPKLAYTRDEQNMDYSLIYDVMHEMDLDINRLSYLLFALVSANQYEGDGYSKGPLYQNPSKAKGSVVYLAFDVMSEASEFLLNAALQGYDSAYESYAPKRGIRLGKHAKNTPAPSSAKPIGVALWMDGLDLSMTDYEIKRWMFRQGLGNTIIRGLRVVEDEGGGLMAYIEVDNPDDIKWLVKKFGASEIVTIPQTKSDNRVVEHDIFEDSIDGLIEGIS